MALEAGDRGVERGGAAKPPAGAVAAGSYDNHFGKQAIKFEEKANAGVVNMDHFPKHVLADGSRDPKDRKGAKDPDGSKDHKDQPKPKEGERKGAQGSSGGPGQTQPTEVTPPTTPNPASGLATPAEISAAQAILHSGAPAYAQVGALDALIGKLGDKVPGQILAMRDRAIANSLKPPQNSA
jgi:hypothetical protein